jgi:hypothetical protein
LLARFSVEAIKASFDEREVLRLLIANFTQDR